MSWKKPIWSLTGPWGVRIHVLPSALLFYGLFAACILIFSGWFDGVVIYPLMFLAAVLLHEWGHAWMALRQGITVKQIVLGFGGGQCDVVNVPVAKAFWMVLMGPLASLAAAIIAFAAAIGVAIGMMIAGIMPELDFGSLQLWMWLIVFGLINLALCVLNLFPFQPLDGGKLLHLLALRWMEPDRAQLIVGWFGLVLGALWLPSMLWLLLGWGVLIPVLPNLQTHWKMVFGGNTGVEVLKFKFKAEPEPA